MEMELEPGHPATDRGDVETGSRAAFSANGSGGEEDEAEAAERRREAAGSSNPRAGEGASLGGGREQEVSVEIGETYLCQRADKTWRELEILNYETLVLLSSHYCRLVMILLIITHFWVVGLLQYIPQSLHLIH